MIGLFNFARTVGTKLFKEEEEAPEKIQAYIEKDNPGVKDLKVTVKEGVATISGEAKSSSALEKTVLMAGNILGISEVKADELIAPPAPVGTTVQYYEIKKGDSLWKIADKFYNNGIEYKKILAENLEVIKDPDRIYPGQKIRIPLDD